MPDAINYMLRHMDDSRDMTDRDIGRDIRQRVAGSANSFDRFTIELVGKVYNGDTVVYDKSGGILGRLDSRVRTLEFGYKNIWKVLLGMGILILSMVGVDKSKGILEFIDKLLH